MEYEERNSTAGNESMKRKSRRYKRQKGKSKKKKEERYLDRCCREIQDRKDGIKYDKYRVREILVVIKNLVYNIAHREQYVCRLCNG